MKRTFFEILAIDIIEIIWKVRSRSTQLSSYWGATLKHLGSFLSRIVAGSTVKPRVRENIYNNYHLINKLERRIDRIVFFVRILPLSTPMCQHRMIMNVGSVRNEDDKDPQFTIPREMIAFVPDLTKID